MILSKLNLIFESSTLAFAKRNFRGDSSATAAVLPSNNSKPCRSARVKPFNDLTGRQFGFLRVIACSGIYRHRRYWRVKCERCGRHKVVLATNLISGRSRSCGCVGREKASARMQHLMLIEKLPRLIEKAELLKAQLHRHAS